MTYHFIGWLAVFILFGAAFYVFDRRVGIRLYRGWYNWTHEKALAADAERGFIYQRKAKSKFAWAVTFSLLQSVLVVWQGNVNPLTEMVSFLLEVPALMLGFYLGPYLDRLWRRKDKALETLDRIEQGETTLAGLAHDATARVQGAVREVFDRNEPEPAAAQAAEPPEPAAPAPQPDVDDEEAHRRRLKKFTEEG